MNILFLTNNEVSYKLIEWLRNYDGISLKISSDKLNFNRVINDKVDLIISYNYRYLIKKDFVNFFKGRIINLHISLLPWNKGAFPNVWSFLENTPKGVTIHFIDEGLDTGPILFQKEINIIENKETLKSSYELLHNEIQKLFVDNWIDIKNFNFTPMEQSGYGSYHSVEDFKNIDYILGDKGWDVSIQELKDNYKEAINN